MGCLRHPPLGGFHVRPTKITLGNVLEQARQPILASEEMDALRERLSLEMIHGGKLFGHFASFCF